MMEYYSMAKMNKLLVYSTIWINFMYILLNETCHNQKVTHPDSIHVTLQRGEHYKDRTQVNGDEGLRRNDY